MHVLDVAASKPVVTRPDLEVLSSPFIRVVRSSLAQQVMVRGVQGVVDGDWQSSPTCQEQSMISTTPDLRKV